MRERADYSAVDHLRDGRPIQIRALRPDGRVEMFAAIGRPSPQLLQQRFFAPKKGFSEREMAFFLNIDFESHFALVALIDEDGPPVIVGGGRYIVVRPGHAEIAFVVIDAYQGQGIGNDSDAASGCRGARGGPPRADRRGVAREHRNVESVQQFGFRAGPKREAQVIQLA